MSNKPRTICAAIFVAALFAPPVSAAWGGDREAFAAGVALLRAGKPKAALAELRKAEKSFGDDVPAELLADLALAAQGADSLADAAAYAERAASRDDRFVLLRDTVIGAVRLREAREAMGAGSPEGMQRASEAVQRSIDAFTRALTKTPKAPRARRNLERALKLAEELEKQKKDQEKEDDESKNDDKKKDDEKDEQKKDDKKNDEKQDDDKKDDNKDEQKQDEQEKDDDKQRDDKQQDDKQQDDKRQDDKRQDEKKGDEQQQDQQQRDEDEQDSKQKSEESDKNDKSKQQKSKSKPSEDDKSAANEDAKPVRLELTPAEMRKLKEKLSKILEEKKRIRARRATKPKPGKKDW